PQFRRSFVHRPRGAHAFDDAALLMAQRSAFEAILQMLLEIRQFTAVQFVIQIKKHLAPDGFALAYEFRIPFFHFIPPLRSSASRAASRGVARGRVPAVTSPCRPDIAEWSQSAGN